MGEWNIVGEFHKTDEPNINGRLGDIRGRPNESDLLDVENRVKALFSGSRSLDGIEAFPKERFKKQQ